MASVRSHSARSAWIETVGIPESLREELSHSARSAWIETSREENSLLVGMVALRKECVD